MLVGVRIDNPVDAGSLSADFFILAPDSKGAAQTRPVKGVDLWGVAVSGGSGDSIDTAIKAGADFIVIEDESAPGSALLMKILEGDSWSVVKSRTIAQGPSIQARSTF